MRGLNETIDRLHAAMQRIEDMATDLGGIPEVRVLAIHLLAVAEAVDEVVCNLE